MIQEISLSNIYSIYEPVHIDFQARHKEMSGQEPTETKVIKIPGGGCLKSIGMFGANASGKSNIIKAIREFRNLIVTGGTNGENNLPLFKFRDPMKGQSSFSTRFIWKEVEYEYSLLIEGSLIQQESLYYWPRTRKAKIFDRSGNDISFGKAIPKPTEITRNLTPSALILYVGKYLGRGILQQVYDFFEQGFKTEFSEPDFTSMREKINTYKPFIKKALQVCDSDITDIYVKPEGKPGFVTVHKGDNQVTFDFAYEESEGTKRLIYLIIELLSTVGKDKTIVIDEFDVKLHPRLAEFLLEVVHASAKTQLLFATHNADFLDNHLLRPDQITFVRKKENGASEIYALDEFEDLSPDMDIRKAYLQGRFDAVPFITSSLNSIKALLPS